MKDQDKVRDIPGKAVHRNAMRDNIDFLKSRKHSSTVNANQRAYTKPILQCHVDLADRINKLCDNLKYSRNNLLYLCAELKLKIGTFTVQHFLNKKYGPAFPPTKHTVESFVILKQFLEKTYSSERKTNKQTTKQNHKKQNDTTTQ